MNNRTHIAQWKDPWLAVLLSKVFPGAGQVYGGEKARGVFFISLTIVLYSAMVLGALAFLISENAQNARTYAVIVPTAMLVMFALSIYVLFDAYKVTKRRNPDTPQTAAVAGYRKAWLAAFLSSIIPGVGQFYNRNVIKGVVLLAAAITIGVFEDHYASLIIISLLVYVFGIKDAFDSAEALNGSNDRFFRQEKTVVLFMVIMFSLQAITYGRIIKENIIETFKIPSGAMYPTLMIGDHFLLGKLRPFFTSLKRGDIVVFPYPKNPKKNFVKRVIGLGGDKIQIIKGEFYINNHLIPATLIGIHESDEQPPSKAYGTPKVYEERIGDAAYRVQYLREKSETNDGPWLVPEDAVFVMGDNRDNSQDSRVWGTVPQNTIKGKALKIYWSWDSEAAKVRWERIGEKIY